MRGAGRSPAKQILRLLGSISTVHHHFRWRPSDVRSDALCLKRKMYSSSLRGGFNALLPRFCRAISQPAPCPSIMFMWCSGRFRRSCWSPCQRRDSTPRPRGDYTRAEGLESDPKDSETQPPAGVKTRRLNFRPDSRLKTQFDPSAMSAPLPSRSTSRSRSSPALAPELPISRCTDSKSAGEHLCQKAVFSRRKLFGICRVAHEFVVM